MPTQASELPDITLGQVNVAEQNATSQFSEYGLIDEPFYADPRQSLVHFDDERSEQTLTLLLTLGYLEEPAGHPATATWSQASLEMAWADWKRDYRVSMNASQPGGPGLKLETELDVVETEDDLRRHLKACATLEGEVAVLRWPTAGETTLESRIVLARLRLFGLAGAPVQSPFPAGLAGEVRNRARWIGEGNDWTALDIVNRLGDIRNLSQIVSDKLGQKYALLRAANDVSLPDQRIAMTHAQSPKRRGGGNNANRFATASFSSKESVDILNLKSPSGRDWNELAVKTLQVRLWMLGYYEGAIDSDWGTLSDDAYSKFLDDYELEKKDKLKIRTPRQGTKILKVSAVFDVMMKEIDVVAEKTERKQIDETLEAESQNANTELWSVMQDAYAKDRAPENDAVSRAPQATRNENSITLRGSTNMKRRRYQGWRGIFSAFGRFFRKAKDAVVSFAKGLIDALKKGIGYAMNVVRYVVGATRMAVRVTKLSIQRLQGWLFGKVIGSGTPPQVTMTRYQLDFDTLQVVDRDCPEAIVTQHSRVLDWMQRSFEVMITIAMKVVKVVLAAVNWLLLAWRVLQLIREVVKIVKADPLHGLFDKSAAI